MTRLVVWALDDDVIGAGDDGLEKPYRTVIVRAGERPAVSSVALCIGFEERTHLPALFAVAKVRNAQRVATNRLRVRLEPFELLHEPVLLDDLARITDDRARAAVTDAGRPGTVAIPLTERTSGLLREHLRTAQPDISEIVERLVAENAIVVQGNEGERIREERDAVQLAAILAGMPDALEITTANRSPDATGIAFAVALNPYFLLDTEDDLIASDLLAFDGNGTLTRIAGSASRIDDATTTLTIINVNRKPLEHVLGVDLVYYDHARKSTSLVQYKRLRRVTEELDEGKQRSDWVYSDEADLRKQLKLMAAASTVRPPATAVADWRLGHSPFFYKFVRAEDFAPNDNVTLRGMYVPAEFLRVGIEEGHFRSGPRGGFRVSYDNTPHMTRDTFTQLVRTGWLGSSSSDPNIAVELVAELAGDHEVVLAIRQSKLPKPRTTP
ncbi:MAG: hypothetical protein JWM34_3316 [Ilumatobacteraceae bacterium]|nr:hypothetical protein [Ilumatobacteraceae bacterium]